MLSTNRRANIDTAFLRRMRFIVEFPMPDAEQRELLWARLLVPLGVTKKKSEAFAEALAPPHELSPAQIKGAALSAAYLAAAEDAPIGLEHLVEGVRREFVKEGRLTSAAPPDLRGARRQAHG
jgi:SpoVK/Ycf46/Vps4 family AAA+-type ATPase